jgi:hypothetical protein
MVRGGLVTVEDIEAIALKGKPIESLDLDYRKAVTPRHSDQRIAIIGQRGSGSRGAGGRGSRGAGEQRGSGSRGAPGAGEQGSRGAEEQGSRGAGVKG